ncbi:hypothetical protein RND61_02520 [Streptomyces sp. TRM76323]|uniref:Uncharacterized protein n=1 Tax=Streptomyces tamarix TaxID=3078565 RepID=A0ABU3QEM4_9ACTN|nr:hypothetical protein [Streptomyces tamarix]MDT9680968.1 hypothetical protein [Streptomyces tamarix]
MITKADGRYRELFLRNGLRAADVVLAHREALGVLRDDIETAHLDAHSDTAWPVEAIPAYERALSMARTRTDAGTRSKGDDLMGIDIDVRDDMQFDVLQTLAPFTIHAEAWRRNRVIFSAGDTGTALWIAVTAPQEAQLLARLDAAGVPPTAFTTHPHR